jgi:hypothetical protein
MDRHNQTGNGNPGEFPFNLLAIFSSCKRKFVVCPLVDEETNGSFPFANGLNGLAHGNKEPLMTALG